jgi:hypothetical protein
MPALANVRHEKFAQLLCDGRTYTEAYQILYPGAKGAPQSGHHLAHRPDVKARTEELREEVALRSVMTMSRKREILRQMAEGMIPTSVYNKDSGETFDALQALLADAKLAGEFAPDKLKIEGSNLKVVFEIPKRDEVIEGDWLALPDETSPSAEENREEAPPSLSDLSDTDQLHDIEFDVPDNQ